MSRNELVSIPGDLIASLFPFHILVDRRMAVVQAGASLRRICPGLDPGVRFTDLFVLLRPEIGGRFETFIENQRELLIIEQKDGRFRLRGQALSLPDAESLVFLCTPLVSDASGLQGLGATLSDLALHDPITDLLQLAQPEVIALLRTHKQAARLKDQRAQPQTASLAKGRTSASVTSEIRTPLDRVIGMTELAMQPQLNEAQSEYRRIVQTAADSLLQLVNDHLDRSRIEAGRVDLETVDFAPGAVCEETIKMLRESACGKGLAVHCIVRPVLPPWVVGDPNRLLQVLLSLVSNGIKFTAAGHVALTLTWRLNESGNRALLTFSVQDTRIGILPEDRERASQKFVQLDCMRFGGAGLELYIARSLANAMGGTLRLGPAAAEGATFLLDLELPLAERPHVSLSFADAAGLPALLYSREQDRQLSPEAWRAWDAQIVLCKTLREL